MGDMGLVGTLARPPRASSSIESCCYYASHYKGFTYEPPVQETCDKQTILAGVAFDGTPTHVSANSSDACCSAALTAHHAAWSYDKDRQQCSIFYEVRGRHNAPSYTSGLGSDPGEGLCKIYSSITGKVKRAHASSGQTPTAQAKLYPSWPASSPWVTAVGSTRFLDQQIGKPEMATDQFGSGGGFSDMFPAFEDQKAAIAQYLKIAPQLPPDATFPHGGRATPDVAALGEGYQVVIHGRPSSVGGTSASAPMFAGLVSLLNEARLAKNMSAMGYINPWLYKHVESFTDVTRGDNLRGRGPFVEPLGFNCTKGWDPVTGLGTPLFDKMLSAATSHPSVAQVIV